MSSKAGSGQWQKVSSSSSKKNQKLSKAAKKELEKKLPKIEDLPPLEILPTSFDSLNPKDKPVKTQVQTSTASGDTKSAQKKKVSFDEVITRSTQAKEKLANADQIIYLKEVATIYNAELSCPDESLTTKPSDYLWTQVPKKHQGKLIDLMVSSTSENDRKIMFKFCIENMLKCVEKDLSSWGFRICLQVLGMNCSSQLCTELDKHLEDILRRENIPKRCLAYMWGLGTLGINNPKHGMEVWLKVMMNLLHLKSLAQYAVLYIEQLMQNTEKQLSGTVNAQEFVSFLRLSFDTNSSLNKTLQLKLRKIYPKVKAIALPGNYQQIFEFFLKSSHEEISCYKEMFIEVAVECLQKDVKCFSVWRQLYTETFPMSRELMYYLDSKRISSLKLNESAFQKTIQAFHNTNCDAAQSSQSLTSKKEFKEIYNYCKEFQQNLELPKSSTSSGVFSTSLLVLLVAIVGTFVYDLYLNKFVAEKTTTYTKLQAINVIKYLAIVWKNIKIGSSIVFEWSEVNVFPVLASVCKFVFPYILWFGEFVYNVVQWVLVNTEGIRAILAIYARVVLEWLLFFIEPHLDLLLQIDDIWTFLWPYISTAAEKVIEFTTQLINGEISWCCVKGYLYNVYVTMSNYAVTMWTTIMDYISGTKL